MLPVLVEDVQAAGVGAVDPQQLADEVVDHVGGALVGADLVASSALQLARVRSRCSLDI